MTIAVRGWDQCQDPDLGTPFCRHTALAALAQLRHAAIRNALCGLIDLPPARHTLPGPVMRESAGER